MKTGYCIENDEFPLECVPSNLYTTVAEKFLYDDFANFNKLNRFFAFVCETLPSYVRFRMPVRRIAIIMDYEECRRIDYQRISLRRAPSNVSFECDSLRHSCLDFLRRHQVKTKALHLQLRNISLASWFVRELIQLTKPEKFCSNTDIHCETLIFPEIKELQQLEVYTVQQLSDEIFLQIHLPKLSVRGQNDVTQNGISQFIKEWQRGLRRVEFVQICSRVHLEDLKNLLPNGSFKESKDHANVIYFFENDGNQEKCLRVGVVRNSAEGGTWYFTRETTPNYLLSFG